MEKENKTKIPKPSSLRPLRLLTKSPSVSSVSSIKSLEIVPENTNLVVTQHKAYVPRPGPSFKLRRRSKSLTDLKASILKSPNTMEKENKTKIPKPSSLKPPKLLTKAPSVPSVSNFKSLETVPENANLVVTQHKAYVPRPGPSFKLRRRSKSLMDLKASTEILKKSIKFGATTTATATASNTAGKSGTKRPAPKIEDVVKPKVARQKIPDWDYKSRFNLLNEKHTKLVVEHKDIKDKLADLSDIDDKYQQIVKEYDILKQKYNELIELKEQIMQIKDENDTLKAQNADLTDKLTKATSSNEELQTKNTEHLKTIEELQMISNKYFSLKTEHLALQEANEIIQTENVAFTEEISQLKQNLNSKSEECNNLTVSNANFKQELIKGEKLRRDLHNTIQDLKGNIRVFCRVRPPVTKAEAEDLQCRFNFIQDNCMEIHKTKEAVTCMGKPIESKFEFTFDKIFQPESTQQDVFEELAQLVQSALDGYNVCVLAYGQTGSGKTYTMQGMDSCTDLGLIPRTIDAIFQSIEDLKSSGWVYEVKASFLEIYNENVLDLLTPNVSQNLDICFNEGKGTTVTNLKIEPIESPEKLKDLMSKAQGNRKVAATNFNERSSRSHAVTKIDLKGINKEAQLSYTSSISLVDLAGSESARTSIDERLVETKNINKSLSALGNVMLALYNKDRHIPYRNSKLTYLLQSSLGGNSKTLMVVNISPFDHHFMESINSLRFASKVKEVKTITKRNKVKI